MTTNNIELARKARSVQDLVKITKSIDKTVEACGSILRSLCRSSCRINIPHLSTSAIEYDDAGNIAIKHTGLGPVKKLNVSGKGTTTHLSGKVETFKPPKIATVTQHSDVLHDLYDKSKELDSIEALLLQSFAGSKGQEAALKAIRVLHKTVDDTINSAFSSLGKISEASLPKEVRALGDDLVSYLIKNLEKDTYDNISESSYVTRTKENNWLYSFYITIDNLKNESGYVFDDYNIVLSAVIDKSKNASYYLTTLADFRLPGKFPLGRAVTSSADIKTSINVMLRHNDVINILSKKSLPLSNDDAAKYGLSTIPGVKGANVEDDTLTLILAKKKTTPEQIKDILAKVLPLLNLVVGNKTRKSVITWKPVPTAVNPTQLEFILVSANKEKSTGLNIDKLKELQHALDLSDDEVTAIKHAVKKV